MAAPGDGGRAAGDSSAAFDPSPPMAASVLPLLIVGQFAGSV
jgi:hypothetical protein